MGRAPAVPTPAANVATTNPGRQDVAGEVGETKSHEVMLNFTRSATRGETSTNDTELIRVPAQNLACHITLPFGSSEGLYQVRVQRMVQSEDLRTAQGNATLKNGDVRLGVDLDLSNLPAGRYLLSYRRPGESWHPVPIVITGPTKE